VTTLYDYDLRMWAELRANMLADGIKEEDVPEPGASDQVSTIDMIEDHARFYLAGDGGSPVRINVKMARSLAAIGCAKLVLVETA
jgi:hypothetical protein